MCPSSFGPCIIGPTLSCFLDLREISGPQTREFHRADDMEKISSSCSDSFSVETHFEKVI
jgi:hypothetical protein